MDRFLNSNIEQQSIYEIYRACRLCGAGAGYKMPIIQNVVDLDGREVELKQKIQECVQIEVQQNDKMPPLICELCVDKVNDFYEFLEMCRQTNKRTRLRLGLPPQRMPNGAPDAGDCILGVTEPVFINEDSNEPISKHSSKPYKGKTKGTIKVNIQLPESKRESRSRRPSPPSFRRTTRGSASNTQVTSSKHKGHNQMNSSEHQVKSSAPLKSILKKGKPLKVEEDSLLIPRSKRSRERETSFKESQPKRVKIEVKPALKTQLKSANAPHRPTSKQAMRYPCGVCGKTFNSGTSLSNHSRIHSSLTRHKQSMATRRTSDKPRNVRKEIVPETSYKFAKCCECGALITRKNIRRHENGCRERNTDLKNVIVDPVVKRKMREVQVRVARCDALLTAKESCTAYNIPPEYGLDTACVYPYISSVRSLRIKTEPDADGMVSIDDRIRDAFGSDQVFAHWDSDYSSDDGGVSFVSSPPARKRRVDSLTSLTLKTIFSRKCLGKVPRRHRRVKTETLPDHDTGTTNLIDSFEDMDELEHINDKVASFDDLLNDDHRMDPANAVIEDQGSGNDEECPKERVGDRVETENVQTEDRTEEIDNHETDGQMKVNNKSGVESRRISDSERRDKEDNRKSNIDHIEENLNVQSNEMQLVISVEDNLLDDEDPRSKDRDTDNDGPSIRNPELKPETVQSTEADVVAQPEVKAEVMSSEVNGRCNANVQLSNPKITSKAVHENLADGKEETNMDRSDEEVDGSNKEGEEEGKKRHSKEIEECIDDGNHDNNGEGNVENCAEDSGRIVSCDEVRVEDGGDGRRDECGEVKKNGVEFEHGGELKSASAGVNNEELKVGNSVNKDKGMYKLNMADLEDVSDAELDDCKLMEELDAQIGEERSGKACDKDQITLEDLLPDKAHDIKPIDMDMLTDQFSFDA